MIIFDGKPVLPNANLVNNGGSRKPFLVIFANTPAYFLICPIKLLLVLVVSMIN